MTADGARQTYVVAIDQGTTSTRSIIFDYNGKPLFKSQIEIPQIYPQAGWAEHDPMMILRSVEDTLAEVMRQSGLVADDIAGVGITNQRETTVAWDTKTGLPLHNAVVWLDLRTAQIADTWQAQGGQDRFRESTGLPISTYSSAVKIRWLMENSPDVQKAVKECRCCFGTIDSWLIYKLTGGPSGGTFATDVTNASRYMLMNLGTLKWDQHICDELLIPVSTLPEIRSSAENFGAISCGPLKGAQISGVLGDQHAALLGQGCLDVGEVKGTYGTGCFIVMNTGTTQRASTHGLLTTLSWKLGRDAPAIYAVEGSVAIAGRGVQWLRDGLNLISQASEIGPLATSVPDTDGVTLVPAFSGLFAPHWRSDARGVVVGISLRTTKAHICRALLEGVSFQACDVLSAMAADAKVDMKPLKVDGGMTVSDDAMQIQANLLGQPLLRAKMLEATALGVAFAAGLAVGFWQSERQILEILEKAGGLVRFEPRLLAEERDKAYARWEDALERSLELDTPREPERRKLRRIAKL